MEKSGKGKGWKRELRNFLSTKRKAWERKPRRRLRRKPKIGGYLGGGSGKTFDGHRIFFHMKSNDTDLNLSPYVDWGRRGEKG